MPFLYGGVRYLGVPGRAVLSEIPALGHSSAFGTPGRCHHNSPAGILLLRHRPQHGGADLPLCLRRGHSVRAEFPHQLGRADVLRKDWHARQG